jgi:hypothetical protein
MARRTAKKCKVNHWPPEHRLKIRRATSLTMIGRMPADIQREGKFGNVKRGWFDINGWRLFFRSTWEANYALYLDFLVKQNQIVSWEYEPDVFIIDRFSSARGVIDLISRSITPPAQWNITK